MVKESGHWLNKAPTGRGSVVEQMAFYHIQNMPCNKSHHQQGGTFLKRLSTLRARQEQSGPIVTIRAYGIRSKSISIDVRLMVGLRLFQGFSPRVPSFVEQESK